jgi:hypothetical protein
MHVLDTGIALTDWLISKLRKLWPPRGKNRPIISFRFSRQLVAIVYLKICKQLKMGTNLAVSRAVCEDVP